VPQAVAADSLRRVRTLQAITVVWMGAETALCLFAAWQARSPALLAFGGDSAIELASAVIVLCRFSANPALEHAERRAAQIAGTLLFALVPCVIAVSVMALVGYGEAKPNLLGIGVLVAAAVFMPWLAKQKRRLSVETGSAALRADAVESAVCGYLSLIALSGLIVNWVGHISWADPAAALLLIPLVLREAWEAVKGNSCTCD